jgi:hypothetical protein
VCGVGLDCVVNEKKCVWNRNKAINNPIMVIKISLNN